MPHPRVFKVLTLLLALGTLASAQVRLRVINRSRQPWFLDPWQNDQLDGWYQGMVNAGILTLTPKLLRQDHLVELSPEHAITLEWRAASSLGHHFQLFDHTRRKPSPGHLAIRWDFLGVTREFISRDAHGVERDLSHVGFWTGEEFVILADSFAKPAPVAAVETKAGAGRRSAGPADMNQLDDSQHSGKRKRDTFEGLAPGQEAAGAPPAKRAREAARTAAYLEIRNRLNAPVTLRAAVRVDVQTVDAAGETEAGFYDGRSGDAFTIPAGATLRLDVAQDASRVQGRNREPVKYQLDCQAQHQHPAFQFEATLDRGGAGITPLNLLRVRPAGLYQLAGGTITVEDPRTVRRPGAPPSLADIGALPEPKSLRPAGAGAPAGTGPAGMAPAGAAPAGPGSEPPPASPPASVAAPRPALEPLEIRNFSPLTWTLAVTATTEPVRMELATAAEAAVTETVRPEDAGRDLPAKLVIPAGGQASIRALGPAPVVTFTLTRRKGKVGRTFTWVAGQPGLAKAEEAGASRRFEVDPGQARITIRRIPAALAPKAGPRGARTRPAAGAGAGAP